MFKSILPSKRIPDSEFTMLTTGTESAVNLIGKENNPALTVTTNVPTRSRPEKEKTKKNKGKAQILPAEDVEYEFTRLMDDLQIPPTLRPKLATMEPSVKAAFLKSSQTLAVKQPPALPPSTPRGLRKAHSIESISSPRQQTIHSTDDHDIFRPTRYTDNPFAIPPSRQEAFPKATHGRGLSVDFHEAPRASATTAKASKDKSGKSSTLAPQRYISLLNGTSTTTLDVEVVKKLRLLLRNESASWTLEFVNLGGYSALQTRLNEILQVEWREEQHDDQVLHELLRCFKALGTSVGGCNALRSCGSTPFVQLISLLYSDKKPGDVATRQLMVELITMLIDLYPPSSLPGSPKMSTHSRTRSTPWDTDPSSSNVIVLPSPHANLFSFIRSILLTPAPPPSEDPRTPISHHSFIEELHVPRIYKTYLQELNDICRDYFWVFCHPNNTIWNLDETDEGKVERPRAPGGMTGGVEFEAMGYMITHFKLINSIVKISQDLNLAKDHELSVHKFHTDLFLSGIERIILIARKASTTYYPTLHLEIARYVTSALQSGVAVPYNILKLIGQPPSAMRKPGCGSRSVSRAANHSQVDLSKISSRSGTGGNSTAIGQARETRNRDRDGVVIGMGSPTGMPQLPAQRKITPMMFG